eukprot:CAMPEP_0116105802 /NCGR_PEP_ID=MMETSP0327-20121206/15254_1 /TAXON_ID=44447 /ORGANISM="Pseudo-nitzschia delicatissima, Strain B596" /LENGTH=1859 /DNA_ID=CAMNT_0003598287 /DNA_START=279 /DNA_END=5858 /DNA_ORIENTATION=-
MAAEEINRNPEDFEKDNETMVATASTRNFQNEVRQWFTAMSPEERAAVLGFEDDSLFVAALLSRIVSPSSSTTGSNGNKTSNDGSPDEQRTNNISIEHAPTYSLPPKRTADELFPNGTFDWEAKIAIEIIEKTWEEIMMVGVPNTSGVNQKEFVKTTMKHQNDERSGNVSDQGRINADSKALEKQAVSNGNATLEETSTNDIVSDAYRIQKDKVDAVGKTASATAQETDGDVGTSVSTVTEYSEPRDKGRKGKANNDTSVGSSPSGEGDSNNECAQASSLDPQEFAATAITTTTSSPSAMHGIEAGLQYPSDNNNSRRIAEVMENTRCIFPSASKITSGATTYGDHTTSNELLLLQQRNQKQPFITINPYYLESVTGDELLVAFDEIMAMAYTDSSSDEPCSFILPEEATSASWIDLVRSYATTDASKPESQCIPLYILLLCRFQHSLAKAYSERDLPQPSNGSEPTISYKSAAQWLSALMTRIRELEKEDSPKIQRVISNLASTLPEAGKLVKGDAEGKKLDLEQYLLLPFKVVAGRLGMDSGHDSVYNDVLKKIDSSIGESSPNGVNGSGKGHSAVKTTPGSNPRGLQAGDGVSSDSNTLLPGNENQILPNNGANGTTTKKGKKKKKKKKRKGAAAAAAKAKATELTIETTIDDKGDLEEKGDVIETPTEVAIEKPNEKEKGADIIDAEADKEAPVAEVSKLTVAAPVPDAETLPLSIASTEEEKVVPKLPETSETDTQNAIDSSTTDGFVGVLLAQPNPSSGKTSESKKESSSKETQDTKEDDQDDQWETVEIRHRVRKKSSADKSNTSRPGSQHVSNNGNSNVQNGKKKAPRTKETRARTKNRKMVREILGGVLDVVEETVRRRRAISRERSNARLLATKNISTTVMCQNPSGSSLRDILVRGGKGNNQSQQLKSPNTTKAAPFSYSERARLLMTSDSNSFSRNKNEKPSHISGSKTTKALKAARALPADQNTIPTIASTNSAFTPSITNVTSRKSGVALSTDSSDSESAEAQKRKDTSLDPIKLASPSPPLPTLLNPGNNNSTSSSVASSLDAPHTGHHGNKSGQSENDVGCHLLDVCAKLSTEIDVFMKRRKDALAIRRHERGLVLAALEKTLGLIWAGKPVVEMYGSCATNLDLPSSDLDVVVCGLDRPFVDTVASPSSTTSVASNSKCDKSPVEKTKIQEDGSPDADSRKNGSSFPSEQRYSRHQMSQYQMQMMYGHMSVNAERVLRLAMELEHQPWAVHVKAIPTASVPVIKILADPARLQGAVMNGKADWLVQQPISGQSPPSLNGFPDNKDPRSGNQAPNMSHFQSQQSSPLWRGADVVNGLLKVDITFEGPEHGGIGSTKFSQKVVEDFSSETGLAPESTPQVQVLMVLKELLAQRRSNEPFSGGLSSYALLLLVISMIGERKIIREELDKTERQRRVVAAGGGNSALRSTPIDLMESANSSKQSAEKAQNRKNTQSKPEDTTKATTQQDDGNAKNTTKTKELPKSTAWQDRQEKQDQKTPVKKTGPVLISPPQQKLPVVSSWASIARKTSSTNLTSSKKKKEIPEKDASESKKEPNPVTPETQARKVPSKPSSFADAVAKGKPMQVAKASSTPKKVAPVKKNEGKKRFDGLLDPPSSKSSKPKTEKEDSKNAKVQQTKGNSAGVEEATARNNNVSPTSTNQSKAPSPTAESNLNGPLCFPQGFHDVIEVLCSGETTPGKLLMHFLLFYGQHFESQTTAIDYSGTHVRNASANNGYSVRSSYMIRRNTGSYDPMTGMFTVDPIVVYDPLEGAENNNVARSCFAWSSIRWVFAQSYMTLSSAAEQNASDGNRNRAATGASEGPAYGHDESGHVVVDPSSPLLELLLSY